MATVNTKCNGTYGSHYTLYLGYAINSQDQINAKSNVTVDIYAKSDSSSYGAYNLSAVNPVKLIVGGSTKVDKKIAMDFRNKATVKLASWTGNVSHDSEGKLTLKLEGSFSIVGASSLTGGSISKNWELPKISRASSVTCADGNIGSATTININRTNTNFTHTISYSFGTLSGTIIEKTAETSIGWTIPTTFFAQIPNAKSGEGTISCKTYSGDTLIGTKTTTFNAFVINSEPTIDATIKDINSVTKNLTGDENKLIKYFSNAQVDISATAKNSSTISSYKVVCGGQSGTSESSVINGAESGTFEVSCVDSRGFTASKPITKTLVEYIKLAITDLQLARPTTTSNTVNISLKGNYFNGSFGSASNTLALKFRYRIADGEWSAYKTVSPTISGNTFSLDGNLGDIYDFNKNYEFEVVATDKLMSDPVSRTVSKGIPIIDIGEEDMVVNEDVDVRANLQKNGIDVATLISDVANTDKCFVLGNFLICFGTVDITPVANTPTSESITFPREFKNKPKVFVSANTATPGTRVIEVSYANETTTGCDIVINRTNETLTSVSWFAVEEVA
jgi:hypothetical protein